jgi:hypothetical protein
MATLICHPENISEVNQVRVIAFFFASVDGIAL